MHYQNPQKYFSQKNIDLEKIYSQILKNSFLNNLPLDQKNYIIDTIIIKNIIYLKNYISLILRKHYTPRAPAREVQRRPQNFGKFRTKNEQQRMYSSKMCHIYVSSSEISVHEISGNLGPKKFCGSPKFPEI